MKKKKIVILKSVVPSQSERRDDWIHCQGQWSTSFLMPGSDYIIHFVFQYCHHVVADILAASWSGNWQHKYDLDQWLVTKFIHHWRVNQCYQSFHFCKNKLIGVCYVWGMIGGCRASWTVHLAAASLALSSEHSVIPLVSIKVHIKGGVKIMSISVCIHVVWCQHHWRSSTLTEQVICYLCPYSCQNGITAPAKPGTPEEEDTPFSGYLSPLYPVGDTGHKGRGGSNSCSFFLTICLMRGCRGSEIRAEQRRGRGGLLPQKTLHVSGLSGQASPKSDLRK